MSVSKDDLTHAFPIIIDTDPGIDDALAILYALHSPNIRVKAITTVHGNVSAKQTYANTLEILNVIQMHELSAKDEHSCIPIRNFSRSISIARGAELPIDKTDEDMVDAAHVHGDDGLGNALLKKAHIVSKFPTSSDYASSKCEPLYVISERNAVDEWFFQLENCEPQTLSLVALGPLTNLAIAVKRDTDLKVLSRFKKIVIMGGCIHQPCPGGNITPHAEFNFYADPVAADIVLSSGLPIILVPLDVTETCRLRYDSYKDIVIPIADLSPLPSFVAAFMEHLFGFMGKFEEDSAFDLLHADSGMKKSNKEIMLSNEERIFPSRGNAQNLKELQESVMPIRDRKDVSLAMHDPLAMGVMIDPGIVLKKTSVKIKIETNEKSITKGMCCVDGRRWKLIEPNNDRLSKANCIEIVLKADTTRFFSNFMTSVFGVNWDPIKHSWEY